MSILRKQGMFHSFLFNIKDLTFPLLCTIAGVLLTKVPANIPRDIEAISLSKVASVMAIISFTYKFVIFLYNRWKRKKQKHA